MRTIIAACSAGTTCAGVGLATMTARGAESADRKTVGLRQSAGLTEALCAGTVPRVDGYRTRSRILTVLKAALNHARAEEQISCSDDAWRFVKAYRDADAAKVQYLIDAEQVRLMNACPQDCRGLVTAALLTGCRYGELAIMTAAYVDPLAGTLTIPRGKSGKARHVVLDEEGQRFFGQVTAGKSKSARLFERDAVAKQATRTAPAETRRVAWGNSDQFRCTRAACVAAQIEPAASFHVLRHTYASRLARRGVPMSVIAAQLGHQDTRMTERHYAHLSPSYVAGVVRQALDTLGIVPASAGHERSSSPKVCMATSPRSLPR